MVNSASKSDCVRKVRQTLISYHMIQKGDGLVLAVSGGPDSVAMTHIMAQLREEYSFRIIIGHLDHSIREESPIEFDFVRRLAEELEIEFHGNKVDVPLMASIRKISIEQAGRIARYDFLEQVRKESGAKKVATAHNSDDVIETFFLRILQGSSLTGLSAIPVTRGNIIRPLLKVSRSEILDFLALENRQFVVDKTNLSLGTQRNFIRNRVIPTLVERFPNFREPTLRTVDLIHQDEQYLESVAEKVYPQVVSKRKDALEIDVKAVNSLHKAISSRIVKSALFSLSPPDSRWTSLHVRLIVDQLKLAKPFVSFELPHGLHFTKDYGTATISRFHEETTFKYSLLVSEPCQIRIPDSNMIMRFSVSKHSPDQGQFKSNSKKEYFDLGSVQFPFVIRPFRHGDTIIPWGRNSKVKVKKLFIDSRTPRNVRSRLPIVIKDEEVIWIPGLRRCNSHSISCNTKSFLEIALIHDQPIRNPSLTMSQNPV